MKNYIFIDVDDTLSPALVTLINAMDPTLPRVVVTARVREGTRYMDTWCELQDMGLDFDELHLREAYCVQNPSGDMVPVPGVANRSPVKFKLGVLQHLKDVADLWPLVAIDDDLSVGAALTAAGVPVVRVLA